VTARSCGGVVLRVAPGDGGLAFLPASIALRVAPSPKTARVPGAPPELVGIAAHEGDVLPVVSIVARAGDGPAADAALEPSGAAAGGRDAMVVCAIGGELVGIVGGAVLATGVFPAADDAGAAVVYEGVMVRPLDVASIVARIQAGARRDRWGG